MNRLYQKKHLQEPKRYGNAVMEDEKRECHLENEKNSADNMLLAVCLNVDFVERACQDEDGIVVQSIKKLFGSVSNLQNMEKDFAQIVKEFQNRLLRMRL